MPINHTSKGGLEYVELIHPSGNSTAEVCSYGATVTSFKSALPGEDEQQQENLFLSKKSILDGSKAIRGGIPLVFPQFGAGKLMNHGFARISTWRVGKEQEEEEGGVVSVEFHLESSEKTMAIWPFKFALTYRVSLTVDSLSTAMMVTNPDDTKSFDFQTLLHTYYKVNDITSVKVEGLKGSPYIDQLQDGKVIEEERDAISFSAEFDSIFHSSTDSLLLSAVTPSRSIRLDKTFTSPAGDRAKSDVVVWNPWIDKAKRTGDMGDEEYQEFFCAEPGVVSDACKYQCNPGETWCLSQTITPVSADAKL